MCGIAGIVQKLADRRMRASFLAASAHYLRLRGPDGFGIADLGPQVALATARLAIVDVRGGVQPMDDPHGAITFNGEIYNHAEIRSPYVAHRTSSDTEVLLKGLNAVGPHFLREVEGMFAFGHFDKRTRTLLLARDLFGIKQLYYFFDGQTLAFASRLQPLMLLSNKEIDEQALVEYYAGRSCRAPRTIFADIHELRAGEALCFDLDGFAITAIERWAAPMTATRTMRDKAQAITALGTALTESVRSHLQSDVPRAMALSGGIDSGLLTMLAAKIDPEVSAFSVGFGDQRFDETRFAGAVCRAARIRHHVSVCDPAAFAEHVDCWPDIMDDVVADPAAIPLAMVASHAASLGYKVLLCGDGADEIFGGYNQYARFALTRRAAWVGRHAPFVPELVARVMPARSRHIQAARSLTVDAAFYGAGTTFEPFLLSTLFSKGVIPQPSARDLAGALALDLDHRLPDDALTRTDRATMHASVEARVPFLSRAVWDVARSLHADLLIRGRARKYILREFAKRHVPLECVNRPKVGLDLPLAAWLRGPLRARVADRLAGSWQADFLRPGVMDGVVADHMAGRNDNADKIWAFMLLEQNVRALRAITAGQFAQVNDDVRTSLAIGEAA